MFSVEVSFTFMPFMFVLISDKWLYFVVFFFFLPLFDKIELETSLWSNMGWGPGVDGNIHEPMEKWWRNLSVYFYLDWREWLTKVSISFVVLLWIVCIWLVQILLQYWVLMKCSLSGGFNNVWFFSRFAGRTVSSGALVLLSVEMKETSCGLLTINTEKSVMASMLLRDLTHALAQS